MHDLVPRLHPTERAEALRYVPEEEVSAFASRQRAARLRSALMDAFYLRYPCRMGVLHRLAAAGIAVARFSGVSEVYDAIGQRLMPIDVDQRPRTELWAAYVRAFEEGRPADYREERWLEAHLSDMEQVRAEGWVERFEDEHRAHRDDPMWWALREHMSVTLGTRVQDAEALAGEIPLETAMATSLGRVVRRLVSTGFRVVRIYAGAAARAMLRRGPWVPPHAPSDGRLVCSLVRATLNIAQVRRIWRLGVRRHARGAERAGAAWSLEPSLGRVLDADLERLDPRVRRLFAAMHRFEMTASVHLYHRLGRGLAWLATLLVGQGMYEEELAQVPARFRLFRRDDGSLHFVREFWCDEEIRVFDSDFVVREVDGVATLLEVFTDLGVAARMRTEVSQAGALSMTIVGLFVAGIPVRPGPIEVCFVTEPGEGDGVHVRGVLDVRPRSRLGRWWWHRVMGIPERVGEIRYFAEPASEEGSS